jgi:hypothetical protein
MITPKHINSKRMKAPCVTDQKERSFEDLEYMLWQGETVSLGESDCIQANCVTDQRKSLFKFMHDGVIRESPRLSSQHTDDLFVGHPNLFAHWQKTLCNVTVVLLQKEKG